MIQIKEYRPAYFTGFENKTFSFQDDAELLAHLGALDNWTHGTEKPEWRISEGVRIMATYKNGAEWWVYATILSGRPQLPEWPGDQRDIVNAHLKKKDAVTRPPTIEERKFAERQTAVFINAVRPALNEIFKDVYKGSGARFRAAFKKDGE